MTPTVSLHTGAWRDADGDFIDVGSVMHAPRARIVKLIAVPVLCCYVNSRSCRS